MSPFCDRLEMRDNGESIEILDLRKCHRDCRHELRGIEADIYRLCRAPLSRSGLLERLGCEEDVLEQGLVSLQERKILVGIREEFLALAVQPVPCPMAKL